MYIIAHKTHTCNELQEHGKINLFYIYMITKST